MAHTTTINSTEFLGGVKHREADIEISDYDTGGENIGPGDLGLNRFQWWIVNAAEDTDVKPVYDEAEGSLYLRDLGDGTEAAAGTSVMIKFVGAGK